MLQHLSAIGVNGSRFMVHTPRIRAFAKDERESLIDRYYVISQPYFRFDFYRHDAISPIRSNKRQLGFPMGRAHLFNII